MKTRDIALGSIMIAVFVVIGLVFNIDVRPVQTYAEIIKIAVIAICLRKFISPQSGIVFLMACLAICFLVFPMHYVLIYNIPCLIGGYVLGRPRQKDNKYRIFVLFYCINTLMIAYEFLLYHFLLDTNLFYIYREGTASIFQNVFGITIPAFIVDCVFVFLLLLDSLFSSVIIYMVSEFAMRRVDKIIK